MATRRPKREPARKVKTEAEIVAKCNELAREFYRLHGYELPEDYKMYDATHPQEVAMWTMAVHAYDHIEGTDVEEALRCVEADEG